MPTPASYFIEAPTEPRQWKWIRPEEYSIHLPTLPLNLCSPGEAYSENQKVIGEPKWTDKILKNRERFPLPECYINKNGKFKCIRTKTVMPQLCKYYSCITKNRIHLL